MKPALLAFALILSAAAIRADVKANPYDNLQFDNGRPVLAGENVYEGGAPSEEIKLAYDIAPHVENLRKLSVWVTNSKRDPAPTTNVVTAMLRESAQLSKLIARADIVLQKGPSPTTGVKAPKMYTVSLLVYFFEEGDPAGSPKEWEIAQTRGNLASGLAYLLQAQVAESVNQQELLVAQNGVAQDRAKLAKLIASGSDLPQKK